jgi:hypothetical protein
MSVASALRLTPDPPPRLRLMPRDKVWFAYECQAGLFNPRIFLCSVLFHIAVLISLPTLATRVQVLPATAALVKDHEVAIIYAPALPEIESSSKTSHAREQGTQGTQEQSDKEVVRTISSDREPISVLVRSQAIVPRAPSELASVLPIAAQNNVGLARQPIEIVSERPKDKSVPAPDTIVQVKTTMASLPSTRVRVGLAPQPIEIASDAKALVPSAAPQVLPLSAIPVSTPKLPVVSANVQVRKATFISGGSRALPMAAGGALASLEGAGAIAGSRGSQGIPGGILGSVTTNVVLNPLRASEIGSSTDRQGRLAAAPDGVPSGQGLGQAGGGRSERGDRGTQSSSIGAGSEGSGNVGPGTQPGAGRSPAGSSDVAIEGGVINLESFGSAPPGPLRGRRPAIVVVSSANAGGALQQFASHLRGQIYTIYLNAAGATAVMQFSQVKQADRGFFVGDLIPPESIFTVLPNELRSAHQVISCVLTTEGKLKEVKILDGAAGATSQAMREALETWRFRPAYRGDSPIEVNVLLGFGVDTN